MQSFYHISWSLVTLMILLKMLLFTSFLIIYIIVSIAIWFFLIFFSHFHKRTQFSCRPILMRSYMSLFISMAFLKSNHRGQFAKLLTFYCQKLLAVLLMLLMVMVDEGTKNFVPRKKFVFLICFFSRSYGSTINGANRILKSEK